MHPQPPYDSECIWHVLIVSLHFMSQEKGSSAVFKFIFILFCIWKQATVAFKSLDFGGLIYSFNCNHVFMWRAVLSLCPDSIRRNLFGEYSKNSPRAPPCWVLESSFFCSLGLLEVGIGNGEEAFPVVEVPGVPHGCLVTFVITPLFQIQGWKLAERRLAVSG